ncbi:hypothetical protein BDQ12DRAFT_732689 [Crucibulum laeve]|uniref:DUF6535 domain-containing protein n=1 Tax=Crucibulum laeve TaxID=68775 RepID=A0A5C3M9J6_9AGAR|nr:hypothetical protein BDQ12DRAFT_732689 [Crucibulum laeve]
MSERKGVSDGYHTSKYDNPSAKLWSVYLSEARKYDKALAHNWKGDMDAILIFAGLFSASVTAFIIEGYRNLSPDPNVPSLALLAQISRQLAMVTNTSTPLMEPIPKISTSAEFSPTTLAVVYNILWFLSLSFSLVCALSATMVEQWTRSYLHSSDRRPAPQDSARINAYLFQGIEKYGMSAVVEAIPTLLHISLFLFFAGLVVFLFPVNATLGSIVLTMFVICCGLYFLITFLPIYYLDCPYRTPGSFICWRILQILGLLQYEDADGIVKPLTGSMSDAQDLAATEVTLQRHERDLKAMSWAIKALREDSELEPFIEVIPNVASGADYSSKRLLLRLLHHQDVNIRLDYRIPQLLATCNSGVLDAALSQKRAVTCLTAIWSITMISMPNEINLVSDSARSILRFSEDTLGMLYTFQVELPTVREYIASTATVVARGLLDMHMNRIKAFQHKLIGLIHARETMSTTGSEISSASMCESKCTQCTPRQQIIHSLRRQLETLKLYLIKRQKMTIAMPYVIMETIAQHHTRLINMLGDSSNHLDMYLLHDVLNSLQVFEVSLNQAGFSLALEYIQNILSSSSLPYEAFNTVRRAVFKIDCNLQIDHSSQSLLVEYLDEIVERERTCESRKVPLNIIDRVLGMTRALNDPICVNKAKGIINRLSRITPRDAAMKALTRLDAELEMGDDAPLELFTFHLYTDVRIAK